MEQIEECDYDVNEAVVTDRTIAIDWTEDGEKFHLLAKSSDGGVTYQGHFGWGVLNNNWMMEITRYTAADGDILLLANGHRKDTGDAGACLFEIWPNDE
jgi:hypothetical protein